MVHSKVCSSPIRIPICPAVRVASNCTQGCDLHCAGQGSILHIYIYITGAIVSPPLLIFISSSRSMSILDYLTVAMDRTLFSLSFPPSFLSWFFFKKKKKRKKERKRKSTLFTFPFLSSSLLVNTGRIGPCFCYTCFGYFTIEVSSGFLMWHSIDGAKKKKKASSISIGCFRSMSGHVLLCFYLKGDLCFQVFDRY